MIDTQAANKKHIKSSRIYTLILFTYIFLSYIKSSFGLPDIYLQLFLYSFFGISFIRLLFNRFPNTIITFAFWYGGFIALSLISSFYADSSYMTMIMIKDLVMAFLMGVSFLVFLQTENGIEKCKNIFIISGIIVGIYMAFTFNPERWWSRLGEDFGVNSNIIGLMYLIPLCFAFTNLYNKKKLLLNNIALIICGYNVFISGSKKALFGFLVFVLIYLLMDYRISKKIKNIIFFAVMIVIIIALIMNTPVFYNVIGHRIEEMYQNIYSDTNESSSTNARMFMIQYGWELFSQRPAFGYGLNNYAYRLGVATGRTTYAHNNYIEILVGLGIIGFIAYYSLHFYLTNRLLKLRKLKVSFTLSFFIAIMALILFYDLAMVSYYDTRIIILISLIIQGFKQEQCNKQNLGGKKDEAVNNIKRL